MPLPTLRTFRTHSPRCQQALGRKRFGLTASVLSSWIRLAGPIPIKIHPANARKMRPLRKRLHMMNATELHSRVTSDKGRAAKLAASDRTPEQIVEELYLLVYARFPDSDEREFGKQLFGDAPGPPERKQATEDLLWALLNTPEFLFKD